jgi:hypothetical protein
MVLLLVAFSAALFLHSQQVFIAARISCNNVVRFQVFTVASIKTRAFWDIAPCRFRVD